MKNLPVYFNVTYRIYLFGAKVKETVGKLTFYVNIFQKVEDEIIFFLGGGEQNIASIWTFFIWFLGPVFFLWHLMFF